jgi:hypothetical protein
MERPDDDLKALARKCRELADGITDEETRKSLRLLAHDYEVRAAIAEGREKHPKPDMPLPE